MRSFIYKFFIGVTLILCSIEINAQSKIHFGLNIQASLGLSENGNVYDLTRKDSKMYGKALNLTGYYAFSKRFEAGLGIGFERLEKPGYNLRPCFVSLRYYPIKKYANFYTFSQFGFASGGDTYVKAKLFDLGVGYRKMMSRHFGLNFFLCYSLREMKASEVEPILKMTPKQTRHSLTLGVGIII